MPDLGLSPKEAQLYMQGNSMKSPSFFNKLGHWQHSVIRRSVVVLAFSGPAMLFNLGLAYVATTLLSPDEFGIFYLAITITNVAFAPSVVLTLFYSRYFVVTAAKMGEQATLHVIRDYVKKVSLWAGLLSFVTLAGLLAFGELIGISAPKIIFLIVLTDYLAYIAETARAAMQGLHQFVRLGLYTMFWMGFRFLLAIAGLVLFETVSAGLLGVALSAMMVFPYFYVRLNKQLKFPAPETKLKLPKFSNILPVALGYSTFVLISYLDILLAYFVLNQSELGAYSASTVLPKGIILLTMPIMQVVFPVIVGKHHGVLLKPELIVRSIAITLFTAIFAATALILSDVLLCSGDFGIKYCQTSLITTMALAAIPLCLVRLFVMIQFAMGRDWMPLLLIVPTLIYFAYAYQFTTGMQQLAAEFMVFSYGLFIYYSFFLLFQSGTIRRLLESRS